VYGMGSVTALASVIVPCYNHGHYLPAAIESVLAHAARNAGIRLALGEFMAFLDADDLWAPQFLQTCVDYLVGQQGVAGVYTASRFVDAQGQILPQRSGALWSGSRLRQRLLEGGFFPPNSVLVRTAAVREVGMFDTGLKGMGTEDWDLWLRITGRYSMHAQAEPLAYYRVYPGSMATQAAGMHACRMSVLTKHLGPSDGDPASWLEEKRRSYGFAYRSAALDHIRERQPEQGWRFLAQAADIYPPLLHRLDTFYELACGDQPRGYRGEAFLLDIHDNGTEMLQRLEHLFSIAVPEVATEKRAALGNAYLALGMLSDRIGDWRLARRYLRAAILANPNLVRSRSVVRRLLKVHVGHRAAELARILAGRWARQSASDSVEEPVRCGCYS